MGWMKIHEFVNYLTSHKPQHASILTGLFGQNVVTLVELEGKHVKEDYVIVTSSI